jgi:hypothetical protein
VGSVLFEFEFILLPTDPLQGRRPHGYRNSQTVQIYIYKVLLLTVERKAVSHRFNILVQRII